MLCDRCRKEAASVTAVEIKNGVKTKRALCAVCFHALGLGQPFSAADILQEVVETAKKIAVPEIAASILSKMLTDATVGATTKRCPDCGTTAADLQKRGLVGCSKDYEVFADELMPLIERLHAKRRHAGKAPAGKMQHFIAEKRLTELKERLKSAVKAEQYEDAARFRDEIRELEQRTSSPE